MPVVRTYRPAPTFRPPQPKAKHKKRTWLLLLSALVLIFGIVHVARGDAMSNTPAIQSGVNGACLDLRHNDNSATAKVQAWSCNNSAAQHWSVGGLRIKHQEDCLGVAGNAVLADSLITVAPCSDAPGQVWLSEQGGYRNPHSGLCLNDPNNALGEQLTIASCRNLNKANEIWTPVIIRGKQVQKADTSCTGDKSAKIACYAAKEWATWQAPGADHNALLNMYTVNVPYEAWCADFVSYVYKEAGYPFTQGETNGWNENDANKIESMGFTRHDPSNYIPKTGDIAYFDYDGGHVEIVVSGGKTPTFIYGNSGTTDPATGNGLMAANTITSDGPTGSLQYYLSPQ